MEPENPTKSSKSFSAYQRDSLRSEISNRVFYNPEIEQGSDDEKKHKKALAQLSDIWEIDPRILERFVVEKKNPHQTTLEDLFNKFDSNTLFPVENALLLRKYLDWGASVKPEFIVELHPPSSMGEFIDGNHDYIVKILGKLDTVTSFWNKDLPCSPVIYVKKIKNFPTISSTVEFFDGLKEGELNLYVNKVPSFMANFEHPYITQLVLTNQNPQPDTIALPIDFQQLSLKTI